jgi:hypothetical protein
LNLQSVFEGVIDFPGVVDGVAGPFGGDFFVGFELLEDGYEIALVDAGEGVFFLNG